MGHSARIQNYTCFFKRCVYLKATEPDDADSPHQHPAIPSLPCCTNQTSHFLHSQTKHQSLVRTFAKCRLRRRKPVWEPEQLVCNVEHHVVQVLCLRGAALPLCCSSLKITWHDVRHPALDSNRVVAKHSRKYSSRRLIYRVWYKSWELQLKLNETGSRHGDGSGWNWSDCKVQTAIYQETLKGGRK